MILTRFVRIQLAIFLVLTVVGVSVMAIKYVQLPAMFGIGRNAVTVHMPSTGGLYKNANVTYLGSTVGTVKSVDLTASGVQAKVSIDSGANIPVDSKVSVRSVSAIGEQYLEFTPQSNGGPLIGNGFEVPADRVQMPTDIGPILDEANQLLEVIPREQLTTMIDETFLAFNDSAGDLKVLIESAKAVIEEATGSVEPTKTLIEELGPLLDTQVVSGDDMRAWVNSLASFTGQLVKSDPELRSVLAQAPGATSVADQLMKDISPTLPLMLANTVSVGQVTMTYNDSIQQLLVVYPALMGALQTLVQKAVKDNNKLPLDFHLALNDPQGCSMGYLSPEQRRPANDVTIPVTPDGIYCRIPQDAQMSVRGARNAPCPLTPGKRAPTPALCEDSTGYVPLGEPTPPFGPAQPDVPGAEITPYQEFGQVGTASYDPGTGQYVAPNGEVYADSSLVPSGANGATSAPADSWQAMLSTPSN
ncbi:MCE family protein [Tomitella biformata]|uniref:MCE family protein n=1 Tax=Tomitella biformata TaxID=630403 RepID=UPI0004657E92|nr:MlaD family protein [Tomitella biformata]